MRVTIVGIGGIGSHLADWIARYLNHAHPQATLTLVDGDRFEDRNAERQSFDRPGNKAEVVATMLSRRYPAIRVEAVTEYLTPENAAWVFPEGEVVLAAVDNHKTRKLVSDEAATRQDATVIAGGNDADGYGTVLVYARRDGRDVTPPLTQDFPEIAAPTERAPWEMSCEELAAAGSPQVLFANLTAAVAIANAYWRLVTDPTFPGGGGVVPSYSEVHFDIRSNRMMSRSGRVVAAVSPPAERILDA